MRNNALNTGKAMIQLGLRFAFAGFVLSLLLFAWGYFAGSQGSSVDKLILSLTTGGLLLVAGLLLALVGILTLASLPPDDTPGASSTTPVEETPKQRSMRLSQAIAVGGLVGGLFGGIFGVVMPLLLSRIFTLLGAAHHQSMNFPISVVCTFLGGLVGGAITKARFERMEALHRSPPQS